MDDTRNPNAKSIVFHIGERQILVYKILEVIGGQWSCSSMKQNKIHGRGSTALFGTCYF